MIEHDTKHSHTYHFLEKIMNYADAFWPEHEEETGVGRIPFFKKDFKDRVLRDKIARFTNVRLSRTKSFRGGTITK